MYKLLLVSDREDVLDAFAQVDNWDYNGFAKPHIRHDPEGAKESLQKHHADGIAIALDRAESEEELIAFLWQEYPLLPIFEAGRTPAEVQEYLGELKKLLNRVRVDFSSDVFDERQMMIRARRHFFRGLVGGKKMTCQQVYRQMRLLRSRMDPDLPCIEMDLEQCAQEEDRWQDSDHLLERELFQSFGGDVKGFHVLPLVTNEGRVVILAGALRGATQEEDVTAVLDQRVRDGIQHAEEYQGLQLRVQGIQVLPSMYAFCTDYAG
ncbi:MAG: hypothetical protein K5922_00210 [Clostridiales bacterium]|nr:hypothetical protein [Clostridiales bacterium]